MMIKEGATLPRHPFPLSPSGPDPRVYRHASGLFFLLSPSGPDPRVYCHAGLAPNIHKTIIPYSPVTQLAACSYRQCKNTIMLTFEHINKIDITCNSYNHQASTCSGGGGFSCYEEATRYSTLTCNTNFHEKDGACVGDCKKGSYVDPDCNGTCTDGICYPYSHVYVCPRLEIPYDVSSECTSACNVGTCSKVTYKCNSSGAYYDNQTNCKNGCGSCFKATHQCKGNNKYYSSSTNCSNECGTCFTAKAKCNRTGVFYTDVNSCKNADRGTCAKKTHSCSKTGVLYADKSSCEAATACGTCSYVCTVGGSFICLSGYYVHSSDSSVHYSSQQDCTNAHGTCNSITAVWTHPDSSSTYSSQANCNSAVGCTSVSTTYVHPSAPTVNYSQNNTCNSTAGCADGDGTCTKKTLLGITLGYECTCPGGGSGGSGLYELCQWLSNIDICGLL